MKEHIVVLDTIKLWTITQGKGLPMMLCNGGSGHGDYLAPVAAMIDDLVQVHRWEQRGCGRSAAVPPYDHATCLTDLETLREYFGHDKPFSLESSSNETGGRYLCRRGTYSIEKARRLLHFGPRVGIEVGMKITEQWLRAEHWIESHG